jgi:hypothetical protein
LTDQLKEAEWAGHVTHLGERRNAYKVLEGKPEGQHYQNKSRNRMGQFGLDSSGSKQGKVVGCCEHGNEPLSYIKCGEIL